MTHQNTQDGDSKMLTTRTLKQEPLLDEKTLLSLLEGGPQARQQMFAHFRATFPNGEPNADGIRGNHIDHCLARFIAQELVGVDKEGKYRLTAGVTIDADSVMSAIERGETTIDDLRFHLLAGKGRARERMLEETLDALVRKKKLACAKVKKDGKDEMTRRYALVPAKKAVMAAETVDAAFLPTEALAATTASPQA